MILILRDFSSILLSFYVSRTSHIQRNPGIIVRPNLPKLVFQFPTLAVYTCYDLHLCMTCTLANTVQAYSINRHLCMSGIYCILIRYNSLLDEI